MIRLAAILVVLAVPALAEITWPKPLYDPAGAADAEQAADLILPMPCGGAMAFQQVNVPVEPGNPIDDRAIRLGQSQANTAYSDYLRPEFLRGAFGNWAEGQSHYFIARYELTTGQFRALAGDCESGGPGDRVAKGDLSWFDAIDIGRRYTEWLLSDAPEALPANGDVRGFIRLPTEVEWEYATRGGSKIDASAFPGRRFLGDGDIGAYAMFQGTARGRMAPVGIRQGNPLGLFDVYGNAEELMLEPFRLNAVGRSHGQVGGLVTRGGSFRSLPDQLYSAYRVEYPLFRPDGAGALAGDTFGVRFVISAPVTSNDAYLGEIRNAWGTAASGGDAGEADASDQLTGMIEEELDPRRKAALDALQLDLRRNSEAASRALQQAGISTLLSGAIVIGTLERDNRRIGRLQFNIGTLTEMARISQPERRTKLNAQIQNYVAELNAMRDVQRGLLLTYRSALETLVADYRPEDLQKAVDLLRGELEAGDRVEEQRLFVRFVADLESYAAAPDMSENEVLALALSR